MKTDDDEKLDYFDSRLFDEVDENFLDAKRQFLELQNEMFASTSRSQISNQTAPATVTAPAAPSRKMPTIAIPKFDGKHSNWISYRDLFKALVVDQPINAIENFSHLRDS